MSGRFTADRQPVAHSRNRPRRLSPADVCTTHSPAASSNRAADHLGVEQVVTPQIEPVGHVVQIRQDLGLRREPLRPRPVALQVLVERV